MRIAECVQEDKASGLRCDNSHASEDHGCGTMVDITGSSIAYSSVLPIAFRMSSQLHNTASSFSR